MRAFSFRLQMAVVVLASAVCATAGFGQQPRLTVDAYQKIKVGIGSMTADEALKLLPGPVIVRSDPTSVTTLDGKTAEYALVWEDTRRIRVVFAKGKVKSVDGYFSDTVKSRLLTPALCGQITIGMARGDVEKLFKVGKGTIGRHSQISSGGETVEEWSQGKMIKALIKGGIVVDAQCDL
jgi:hypothetical protein